MQTTTYKKKLLARMSRLIGHAEANKRLMESDAYCIDIITQNLAVIAALNSVNQVMLDKHLRSCVLEGMQKGGVKEQERLIREILATYRKTIATL